MKGINIESILKRLNKLSEEMQNKAEKTDIFKLESEKAEKITVDDEFKRVWKEIDQLKNWFERLEEQVRKSS
jgi:hypothetical protein